MIISRLLCLFFVIIYISLHWQLLFSFVQISQYSFGDELHVFYRNIVAFYFSNQEWKYLFEGRKFARNSSVRVFVRLKSLSIVLALWYIFFLLYAIICLKFIFYFSPIFVAPKSFIDFYILKWLWWLCCVDSYLCGC